MSVHFSYLRDVVFRPIEFHRRELRKLEENKQRAADDDTGDFAYVSELREEIVRIQGVPRRVRRVFVTAPDAPAYEGVGWILADDMDLCMVCNRTFSMFFDPLIHCHACGSVVCGKCMHLAVVQEIKKLGPVPVCRYCDWGQDTIHVVHSPPDLRKVVPVPIRSPKYENINLWNYGIVRLHDYTPVFVIRTRRVNKTRLYVNVCMCVDVPVNNKSILLAHSKARLALDNHGAVDAIRHNLSYEQAQAAERARIEGIAERRRRRQETERQLERSLQQAIAEKQLLEQRLGANSDDELSEDSELEDDYDPELQEFYYNSDDDSNLAHSEDEEQAEPQYLELAGIDASELPAPARRVRRAPKTPSEYSFPETATEAEAMTVISENFECGSVFSDLSVHSRGSFQRRMQNATNAFVALRTASQLTSEALQQQERAQRQHQRGQETGTALSQARAAAVVESETRHTALAAKKEHLTEAQLPKAYLRLDYETLIPMPTRRGFQRTAAYYDFPDSDSSDATSETSENTAGLAPPALPEEAPNSLDGADDARKYGYGAYGGFGYEYGYGRYGPGMLEGAEGRPVAASVGAVGEYGYTYPNPSAGAAGAAVPATQSGQASAAGHGAARPAGPPIAVGPTTVAAISTEAVSATAKPIPPQFYYMNGALGGARPVLNHYKRSFSGYSSSEDSDIEILPSVSDPPPPAPEVEVPPSESVGKPTGPVRMVMPELQTNDGAAAAHVAVDDPAPNTARGSLSVQSEVSSLDMSTLPSNSTHGPATTAPAAAAVPASAQGGVPSPASVNAGLLGQTGALVGDKDAGGTGEVKASAPANDTIVLPQPAQVTCQSGQGKTGVTPDAHRAGTAHETESVHSEWTSTSLQASLNRSWEVLHARNHPEGGTASYLPAEKHVEFQNRSESHAQAPGMATSYDDDDDDDSEVQSVTSSVYAAQQRLSELQSQLTRSVQAALGQLGPDPAVLARQRELEELQAAEEALEQEFRDAAVTDSGSQPSEYDEELPVDTYLVCGEKGRALDLRDVYDVAVNPEVIYAVNADPSGDLLTKFTQQVLLAVPHVTNELGYPAYDYPIVAGNYQRRFLAKTPEQLEQETRAAKIREAKRKEAETISFTTVLGLLGINLWAEDHDEPVHRQRSLSLSDSESDGGERSPDGQPIDRRPLQMAIPTPVAFKHLTCVASTRSVVDEMPEDFDPSFDAEHPSFEHAKPHLQQLRKDHLYQSMVHRIKASGMTQTKQVRFEAAAFDLREHQQRRAKSGTYSKYTSAYHLDGLSDDESTVAGRRASVSSDLEPRESGMVAPSASVFRSVQKQSRAVTLIAKPAFVIKSRRTRDDQAKVFINVLHHSAIDEMILSGVVRLEPHEEPLTAVGEGHTCRDRSGAKCVVYNALVASSYIKNSFRKYEKRITDADAVAQIVEAVNEICQETLSPTQYSFPRIRRWYKGENPQRLMTFTFRTRKSDRPEKFVGNARPAARRRSSGASVASAGKKGRVSRTRLSSVQEGDESQEHTDSAAEVTDDERSKGAKGRRKSGASVATEKSHASKASAAAAAATTSAAGAGAKVGADAAASVAVPSGTVEAAVGDGAQDASAENKAAAGTAAPPATTPAGSVQGTDEKADTTPEKTADKSHSDSASGGESDSDSGSEEESQASGSSKGRKKGLFGLFRGRSGGSDDGDSASQTTAAPQRRRAPSNRQRSTFSLFGQGGSSGVTITPDMITYYKELSISRDLVDRLKHASVRNPQLLLGWQLVVVLEAGKNAGLFVVTAVSTGAIVKKTEFRLSHPLQEDQWVRLKRSNKPGKTGLFFYPTRKVLFLEHQKQAV